jgi:hypothetical protein
VNSIGNSSIQQQEGAKGAARQSRQPQYIIVLIVILIFVIGLTIAGFLYWRTRIKQDAELNGLIPRPFMIKSIESGGSPLMNVGRRSVTLSLSKRLSSPLDTVTRVAGSVQLQLPPSHISTKSTYVPSDGARDKEKQNLDSGSFPVSGYSSFDDTSANTPRNLRSLTTASFATYPLTSTRATPQYNRGPGKRSQVINQHRKALSVEAEIFHNEPALSDSGSDVLPVEMGKEGIQSQLRICDRVEASRDGFGSSRDFSIRSDTQR